MSDPVVSVIIPLFNHERYIGAALRSVLGQTYADFEVIVVDDGSQDGSAEIVKGFDDPRIHYYHQANQGAGAALNRGVALGRGRFVSVLNSDDMYAPERLSECVAVAEADQDIQAVFTGLDYVDAEGSYIRSHRGPEECWSGHDPATSFKGAHQAILDLLAGNFLITTSNLFCRRATFDSVGPFANLRYAHDYDFYLRLCFRHGTHRIDQPLLKYRLHGANTMNEGEPAVSYEVGLVLCRFFLSHDLRKVLPETSRSAAGLRDTLMKLFHSVNTFHTDRMIMVLLVASLCYGEVRENLYDFLAPERENPFREACVKDIEVRVAQWTKFEEGWKQAKEAWKQAEEARSQAARAWQETEDAWRQYALVTQNLTEKEKELQMLLRQLEELHTRLEDTEKRLEASHKRLEDTERLLWERTRDLEAIMKSWSFRLGRAFTWPMRRLRDLIGPGRGGDG